MAEVLVHFMYLELQTPNQTHHCNVAFGVLKCNSIKFTLVFFNVLVDAVRRQYLLFTGCLIRQLSVVKLNFLTVFHKNTNLGMIFFQEFEKQLRNPILANHACIFNSFTFWIFSINQKHVPESVLIVCFCLSRCDNITLIYRIPQ